MHIICRMDRPMNARLPILLGLIVFSCFSFIPTHACVGQHFYGDSSFLLAKSGEGSSPTKDSKESSLPGIEKYEKEKLAKLKGNIGRRYLTVKKINPAEFYESPDDLGKEIDDQKGERGFCDHRSGSESFGDDEFLSGKI